MFNKVAFTLYPVADVARARAFYEGTLGLESGLVGDHGGMQWIEYDLPGGGCLAISNASGDEPGTGGTIAFEVDDLERVVADLKAKAVEFKTDVIRGPACRMIVCMDSEGNSLLLHQHD